MNKITKLKFILVLYLQILFFTEKIVSSVPTFHHIWYEKYQSTLDDDGKIDYHYLNVVRSGSENTALLPTDGMGDTSTLLYKVFLVNSDSENSPTIKYSQNDKSNMQLSDVDNLRQTSLSRNQVLNI